MAIAALVAHAHGWAWAQPDAGLLGELTAMERRAGDRGASLREREQAFDRAIETRRRVIEAAGEEEPLLPEWLIEQSSALLARVGRDGSDTAVLFGIPAPSQAMAVREAAAEADQLLVRAGAILEGRAKRLSDRGIAAEEERAAAIEQMRTVRVPFFRARALALRAATSEGEERARLADSGQAAVAKLALASAAPEGTRRVNLAANLLLRGQPKDARVALEEVAGLVAPAKMDGELAISPVTRGEAWLALMHASSQLGTAEAASARLHQAMGSPPFVTAEGTPDALWVVLAADAAARALTEQGARTGEPRLLELAIAEQNAILQRTDLGFRGETLRPIVYEKLAALAERVEGRVAIPAGMRLARAIVAARAPESRAAALADFEAVAADPKAGEFGAVALWEWAVLVTQPGGEVDRVQAARNLTRLAAEHPKSPRAEEAMTAALAYARMAAEQEKSPEARVAYEEALRLATTKYSQLADIDVWRYERARLIVSGEVAVTAGEIPHGRTPPDLATALDLLRVIPGEGRLGHDAERLYERGQTMQFALLREALEQARARGEQQARQIAKEQLVPAAERAGMWVQQHASAFADQFQLRTDS